ncbi:MAG: SDR family NAD(P)-dependent oxidoreductase [Kofleriaceae bacterium]
MKLADKLVVITGAGSGIGRATALAFAAEGARIVGCDIDGKRIAAVASELGSRCVLARTVDVADRAQMARFAVEVHDLAPAADIIVNNAGVALGGSFLDTSLDDWEWVLGVNLRGVVHGCHYFVPAMVARAAGGQVINIASIAGVYAPPNLGAYVASKFAVVGLSRSMRTELQPHRIGVTAVCPGMIATTIIEDGRMGGDLATRKDKVSGQLKRFGAPPKIVANAVLEAARTNPEMLAVGRDAKAIHAFTKVAPRTFGRIAATIQRRL